jgi:hypothetical protein
MRTSLDLGFGVSISSIFTTCLGSSLCSLYTAAFKYIRQNLIPDGHLFIFMSGCLPTDVAYTFASFVNHILTNKGAYVKPNVINNNAVIVDVMTSLRCVTHYGINNSGSVELIILELRFRNLLMIDQILSYKQRSS